uniref:Uncharacterized protein n=1 Tax=Anguilla anguilla TaxID=7936 RepID=A0A0E9SRV2_ANGAN
MYLVVDVFIVACIARLLNIHLSCSSTF